MVIPKIQVKGFQSIGKLHAEAVGVKKLHSDFNPSKDSCPDNIPCRVLKEYNKEVSTKRRRTGQFR